MKNMTNINIENLKMKETISIVRNWSKARISQGVANFAINF